MHERSLTIGEVLRFANHDFLNQLQLISMNLQMGNVDAAFSRIEEIQSKALQTSKLSKMQLPKTVEWLLTANWRFSALKLDIMYDVYDGLAEVDSQLDETVASYLEHTVIHVYNKLDPFIEQNCTISIISGTNFQLVFHLQGKWDAHSQVLKYEQSSLLQVAITAYSESELQVIFKVKE